MEKGKEEKKLGKTYDAHDTLDLCLILWFPRTAGNDPLEQLDSFVVGSDGGGYI
jgi:hypothetical protein